MSCQNKRNNNCYKPATYQLLWLAHSQPSYAGAKNFKFEEQLNLKKILKDTLPQDAVTPWIDNDVTLTNLHISIVKYPDIFGGYPLYVKSLILVPRQTFLNLILIHCWKRLLRHFPFIFRFEKTFVFVFVFVFCFIWVPVFGRRYSIRVIKIVQDTI